MMTIAMFMASAVLTFGGINTSTVTEKYSYMEGYIRVEVITEPSMVQKINGEGTSVSYYDLEDYYEMKNR